MSSKGGLRQVHGQVVGAVADVRDHPRLQRRSGRVQPDRLRRRARHLVLVGARLHLREDVVGVRVHDELERVDVVLPVRIGRLVVARVADEDDVVPVRAVIAAHRLDRRARRCVDLVGALDHVRPGRDDVAAVVSGLPFEALGHFLGNRRRRRHRHPEVEVAGRLRQVEDDRRVVGRHDARDRLRLAARESSQPLITV